ncbi:non-specific lipid-transfer protein-like protein At5g64080 [Camellia sinensis]|uniref:non-specific lipid-transfer protein-like protein At5g64080 n=1 Tax=Camellia sinensis TaxID=4442 RepID=UPI001036551D|nr:non-specific lipid-transfer protein-like protein At5g64080 [Camellia sinensis]
MVPPPINPPPKTAPPPPSNPLPKTSPPPPTTERGAPAPSVDCTTLIYGMSDCLTYLTVGSNETKPEDTCCTGLKTVLDTDADCLCEGLKSSASLGFNIDFKKAKAIPSVCKIPTPPSLTSCDLTSSPSTPGAPSSPVISYQCNKVIPMKLTPKVKLLMNQLRRVKGVVVLNNLRSLLKV